MHRSRTRKWLLIVAVIVLLFIVGGAVFMMGKHYVSIRGQHLKQYQYSSGGGMSGGYDRETVTRYDDTHALISTESAKWHNQDPEIKEYLADAAILEELEDVVRQHHMNFWNRKKFTKMFIADGETESYYFCFDEDEISFSSQLYPKRYYDKLRLLDETIAKYRKNAEVLPGLVRAETDSEEGYGLTEGVLELYVYAYRGDALGVRILNGKDEQIDISRTYQLIQTDTGKVVAEKEDTGTSTVYPKSWDEIDIDLAQRLEAGHYKLLLGEEVIPFEIR